MRMMQFTSKFPSTLVRSRLALALAGLILVPSMEAAAVDLTNGASATVVPGHVWVGQNFTLRGNSQLTVDGTRVGSVNSQDSTLTLSNASTGQVTLTDSVGDIRGSTLVGLNTSALLSNPASARTVIAISNSRVESPFTASRISGGGTIRASSTAFAGNVHGVEMLAGILELRSGSSVVGAQDGIYSRLNAGGQPTMGPDGWYVLVDGSSVEGTAGAALSAQAGGSAPQVNRFIVQNGATLKGGNGNLLQANAGARFDFSGRTSTLAGNFTIADTATGTLRFLDGLDLTGRILGPADVIVDQGGRWTLSGDSNTGNLTLGAGSNIFLGAAGTAAYPQLTVNGNYTGNGGTLHFNTVLAGDDAASSRVHVTGNTSGTTQVTVNNIAGAGAQTVNGIPLMQVDGASNGHLALQGRAIGGMYEYFLRKGTPGATNGNWYLTSAYTGNPCDINPALPECQSTGPVDPVDPVDPIDPVDPVDPVNPVDPVPVLRPEPGAYLANQAAAVQMFQLRRHDRGEPGFDRARIGTWVRAGRDQLQANVAGQVDARTHINTLQLGSDVWRWGDGRGQVGVMLGTGEATTQAVSTLSGYGTRGKVKGKSAGVYLGWVQDAQSSAGLYVDGWLQAARFDNEVQGEGIARETYDSRTRSASPVSYTHLRAHET